MVDEQREFFKEVEDEDGEFVRGRSKVASSNYFRTPLNLARADATPEKRFMRELVSHDNAERIEGWLKNTQTGYYSIEYAWKKGEHPKRGEFSPDFFIKQGDSVFVIEIKGDEEISEPSPDNSKKHEYAIAHFDRLNEWLKKNNRPVRYQFNMLSPKSFSAFFQKMRDGDLGGFRSELDVVMSGAARVAP
ncbi:hypothetical protein [Bradyrhizobium sp. USDA 4454]